MNELIAQLSDLSPEGLFVVGCIGFGIALKRSPIQDWIIPYILGITGAIIAPFLFEYGKIPYTMTYPWVYLSIKGAVLAGFSTTLHQYVKQFINRKNEKATTSQP